MTSSSSPWPQCKTDELIKRYKRGESDAEIALAMGKTRVSVRHRRNRIGNMPSNFRSWPQSKIDELIKRQKKGECDLEISLGIGKSRGSVRQRRIKIGLPRNPSRTIGSVWLSKDTIKCVNMEKEGWSVKCTAKFFGRSNRSIEHHLQDHRSPSALRQAIEDRVKKAKLPWGLDCAAMVKHHPNRVRRALQGLSVNNGVFDADIYIKQDAA